MKSIKIKGELRNSFGTSVSNASRKLENIPCIVYGGKKDPKHFFVKEKSFKTLVYTSNAYTVDLEIEGVAQPAILKDIQFHPVTDKILHVDFYRLQDDKEAEVEVPIKIVGVSKGVLEGGVLRKNYRKLRVKALPKNLPDFIEADISSLEIGNKLYVTALASDKYQILHPENTVICQVKTSRNAIKSAAAKK